jgi:hypothetical protein
MIMKAGGKSKGDKMPAPWNLLLIPVIFALLLGCVYLADRILQDGINLKTWWRRIK